MSIHRTSDEDIFKKPANELADILLNSIRNDNKRAQKKVFDAVITSCDKDQKKIEDIYCAVAKLTTAEEMNLFKKRMTLSFQFMKRVLPKRALEAKDLKTFQNLCVNETVVFDFCSWLENVDLEWLKENFETIKRDNLQHSASEAFEITTGKLLTIKRYDIFDFIVNDEVLNKHCLSILDAVISHDDVDGAEHLLKHNITNHISGVTTDKLGKSLGSVMETCLRKDRTDLALQYLPAKLPDTCNIATMLWEPLKEAIKKGQSDFVTKAFETYGEHISAADFFYAAIQNNQPEVLKFLGSQFDHKASEYFDGGDIRNAVQRGQLELVKTIREMGVTFHETFITNARDEAMLRYMHFDLSLDLPTNKHDFVKKQFNHNARRYAETLYLYKDIRSKSFKLSIADKAALSKLSLPQLRKTIRIGNHPKMTGIAIAAQAGAFDIVLNAAQKYQGKNPFNHMDWVKDDQYLSASLVMTLRATQNLGQVFDPTFWSGKEEDLNHFWQRYVPDPEKHLYIQDYDTCLKQLSLEKSSKQSQAPKIKRRPKNASL